MVIVYRGSYGEPPTPISLLGICNEAEVLFDPLILSFRQSVGLGVERGRQVLLGSDLFGQSVSEVGGESGVSIGDDF